jgi:hypothetical protein
MQKFAPGIVLRDCSRLKPVLGQSVTRRVWEGWDLHLERPVAVQPVAAELLAVPRGRSAAPASLRRRYGLTRCK